MSFDPGAEGAIHLYGASGTKIRCTIKLFHPRESFTQRTGPADTFRLGRNKCKPVLFRMESDITA